MKILQTQLTVLIACCILACIACGKGQTTALPSTRFTWTYQGSTNYASQYSAFLYSRGTFLIVGAQGNTLSSFPQCNFSLTSFSRGSYTINSTRINTLRFVNSAGNQLEAITGQVNITAYGSDVISGDFSAILENTSGSNTPISGSFYNIPVVP